MFLDPLYITHESGIRTEIVHFLLYYWLVSKNDLAFYSPEESTEWLRVRMTKLNLFSLEELAGMTDIDRGTISRYFHHERRPSIDVIEPLCTALQVSPETLLKALGAIPK